jgi:dolichyl-diphosphooligosaccharide--protein glycosyltransferase
VSDGPAPSSPDPSHVLLIAAVALCFTASIAPRIDQLRTMRAEPGRHFAEGVPVASADSYLWFRLARGVREGSLVVGERDPLRNYPDGVHLERIPTLSRLLAWLAGSFGGDPYRAAGPLAVLLSSLFVVPVCVYGFRAGLPSAGVLGALVGSFAPAYFARSTPNFFDTDGGNLFFVWLVPAVAAGIGPRRGRPTNAVLAALGGLSLAAFCAWYQQLGFWWLYVAVFAVFLAASRLSAQEALLLLGLFVLLSNPLHAGGATRNLIEVTRDVVIPASAGDGAAPGPFEFASVTGEIQELKRRPVLQTLSTVLRFPALAALGLAGCALFALSRPRLAILLLPPAALGLMAFTTGKRFALYLAPLVGFGLGTALGLGVRAALRGRHAGRADALAVALAFLGMLLAKPLTALGTHPLSRLPAGLVRSVAALPRVATAGAPVSHSWSHGYLIADVAGLATFNDGGWPDPVIEQLQRRAWTSDRLEDLRAILAYLASHERDETRRLFTGGLSYEQALERVRSDRTPVPEPLYVLFTATDLREMTTWFRHGQWDFATGRGPHQGYELLSCEASSDARLECVRHGSQPAFFELDLEQGSVGGHPAFRKLVRIRDGRVVAETDYPGEREIFAQLLESDAGGSLGLQLMHEPVFRSNFNHLFVLGRFDPSVVELVYDDFPTARLYRLEPREPIREAPLP